MTVKNSIADRLQAISAMLGMFDDETMVKFIFDLHEAAGMIRDLDRLLELILSDMRTATTRDLACDGGVGDEEGKVWAKIDALAGEIRERLDRANPEPKVVG